MLVMVEFGQVTLFAICSVEYAGVGGIAESTGKAIIANANTMTKTPEDKPPRKILLLPMFTIFFSNKRTFFFGWFLWFYIAQYCSLF